MKFASIGLFKARFSADDPMNQPKATRIELIFMKFPMMSAILWDRY